MLTGSGWQRQRGHGRPDAPTTAPAPAPPRPSTASTRLTPTPRGPRTRRRFDVGGSGTQVVQYRSSDTAGNVETDKTLSVRVDVTGTDHDRADQRRRAAAADYTGAGARGVHAQRRRRRLGRGRRPSTASTTARGRTTRTRSTSRPTRATRSTSARPTWSGNVENFKTRAVHDPAAGRSLPAPLPQIAVRRPAPTPFAALEPVASKVATLSALRAGKFDFNVSCAGVSTRDG